LRNTFEQQSAHSGSWQAVPTVEEVPRIHIRSPRLADTDRAADFTMDVAEVSPDAGLR
jgi:hypothetical protein